jgi:hypothetical protein
MNPLANAIAEGTEAESTDAASDHWGDFAG